MSTPAAEDRVAINYQIEYERGFAAAIASHTREAPAGCLDKPAWCRGWDEGYRLKPKE